MVNATETRKQALPSPLTKQVQTNRKCSDAECGEVSTESHSLVRLRLLKLDDDK